VAGEPWNVLDGLLAFLDRLEATDFPYAIGGSVASSLFGEPRTSTDTDVVVDLPVARLDEFVAALGTDFYVPRDSARRAVQARSAFNVIHLPTSAKVDIFVAGSSLFDREQFERRVRRPLLRDERPVWISSPEVMVVKKLDWFRRGGEVSDHQWRDVLGILKVQAGRLDEAWMRRQAAALGVSDLLERALKLQGPPPR
jgi:hypothetical protein